MRKYLIVSLILLSFILPNFVIGLKEQNHENMLIIPKSSQKITSQISTNKLISIQTIPLKASIRTSVNVIYANGTVALTVIAETSGSFKNSIIKIETINAKISRHTIKIPDGTNIFSTTINVIPLASSRIDFKLIRNNIILAKKSFFIIKNEKRVIPTDKIEVVSSFAPYLLKSYEKIFRIDGTVDIYGSIYWEDPYGNLYPLRWIKIELWDDDSDLDFISPEDFISATYTDANGEFSFTGVDNSDASAGLDIFFKVFATSTYLDVKNTNNEIYLWESPYDKNGGSTPSILTDLDDGTYYIDIILRYSSNSQIYVSGTRSGTADCSPASLAFQIYALIAEGVKYSIDKGYTPTNKVFVVYPSGDSIQYDPSSDTIYVPSGAEGNKVRLVGAYGLAILDMIYDGGITIRSDLEPLDGDAQVSPQTQSAFSSGFAYFFAAAVWGDPTLVSTASGNIENNSWYTIDGSDMDGDYVAGSIASIFWDIHDETGENGWDPLDLDFSNVFNVIKNNKPLDIHEFWTDFINTYGYRDQLEAIYWHYGIDKDDDEVSPAFSNPQVIANGNTYDNSQTVTIYDSCATGITLQITITDSSGISSVVFHYYLGGYWYQVTNPNVSGNIYYITIPRTDWINCIGSQIEWYVEATDADSDRPDDQLSSISNHYYVTLADDDTLPPSISGISITGDITDAYQGDFVFSITAQDSSGWILEVEYYYEFPNGTTTLVKTLTASTDSTLVVTLSVSITRSEWINYVGATIWWRYRLTDKDSDRIGDESTTDWSAWQKAGQIQDDDSVAPTVSAFQVSGPIYDSFQGDYEIQITVNDTSGFYVVIYYYWNETSTDVKSIRSSNITSSSSQTVILTIPRSEWIRHINESLYIKYEVYDLDNDRPGDSSVTKSEWRYAGEILDDDTKKPNIVEYGAYGNVYDNETGDYWFYVKAFDDSGWILTVEYYYSDTPNVTHTLTASTLSADITTLYVSIPRDEWLSHLGATIYWRFVVTDQDNDRTGDSISSDSSSLTGQDWLIAGTIRDDDTQPPQIESASCNGTIYDNYTRDFYFWFTIYDDSGFNIIVEYYYSSDPNTVYTLKATVNQSGKYVVYVSIPYSEWIAHVGEYIMWRYMANDTDTDRPGDSLATSWYTGPSAQILDDDTEPPSIVLKSTSGNITDAYTNYYFINITIRDTSGFFANVSYWFNDTPNQKYYVTFDVSEPQNTLVIQIPRDVWINHIGACIEYLIFLEDHDCDRSGDSLSTTKGPFVAGIISDDDTNAPALDATYTDPTGTIYDNSSSLRIYIRAHDDSGFKAIVTYWFSDNPDQTYNISVLSNTSGQSTVYVEIPKDIWTAHIGAILKYNITLIDLDQDRPGDSLFSGPFGPYTVGTIEDDDTQIPVILDNGTLAPSIIYDNETIAIVIFVNVSDQSGVTVELRYGWSNATTPPSLWDTLTNSSSSLQAVIIFKIDKSTWSNHVGSYLWFSFRAYDNDNDRINDSSSTDFTPWYRGPQILDDDTKPPTIVDFSIIPEDGDNDLESDEKIMIVANVTDPSGVQSVIARITCNNVIYMYSLTFNGTLWISDWIGPFDVGNITIYLETEDADSDRVLDASIATYKIATIQILPEPTQIISCNVSGNYSDLITIIAYVVDEESNPVGNVSVIAVLSDNLTIGVTSTNATGYALITYKVNVPAGNYTVILRISSEKYAESNVSITLTVYPDVAKIITTNVSATYTDTMTLVATMLDNENDSIINKTIQFEVLVNNKWMVLGNASTDNSGTAILSIQCSLAAGVYKARIVFGGDNYYTSACTYFYITVNKEKTYIKIWNISVNYSDTVTLLAYVYDDENQPLHNVNVTFYIIMDNVSMLIGWALSNASGYATLQYEAMLSPSTYPIIARVVEDSYYLPANVSASITVNKEVATILNPHAWIGYNDPLTIRLRITDDENIPIPNINVSVYLLLNNTWIYIGSNITDTNGILRVMLSEKLNLGNYTLKAIFKGNNFYQPFNITGILTIGKELVLLPSLNVTMIYNHPTVIEFQVTDDEYNPLSNEPIRIEIIQNNTVLYCFSTTTNSSGYVSLTVDLPLNIGVYIIRILHNETEHYVRASVNGTLNVVRIPTHFIAQNITVIYNETTNIIVRLLDMDNIPIENVYVTFVLPTKNITCLTNASGYALIAYLANLDPGQYEVTVQFFGTNIYDSTFVKIFLVVERRPTNISIESELSVDYGDTLELKIRVTDFENFNVSDYPVKLRLIVQEQTLEFTGVTDSHGLVVFHITANFIPGNYTIVIESDGNKYYAASQIQKTLHVSKEKTIIVVYNSEGKYTDTTVLVAQLKEEEGQVLSNKDIVFIIKLSNGSEITLGSATTNEQGIATLEIELKYSVGTYEIIARFYGDAYYLGSNNSAKLNVTKEDVVIEPITTEILDCGGKIRVRIMDDDLCIPVTSAKVSLIICETNMVFTTITNSEGIAEWNLSLPVGTYTAEVIFSGTTNFLAFNKTITISVKDDDTTPPTIEIVGDLPNEVNAGEVTVTLIAKITDPSGIYNATAYYEIESITSCVPMVALNSTHFMATIHISHVYYGETIKIWIVAYDNDFDNEIEADRSVATSDTIIISVIDTISPTVIITEPSNMTYVNTATITLKWNATDNDKIAEIQIYVDDTCIATLPEGNSHTIQLGEGKHTIVVKVFDRVGHWNSSSIIVVVDLTPPKFESITPSGVYKTHASQVLIKWRVIDNIGLYHIEIWIDNQLETVLPPTTTEYAVTLSEGNHTITLVAIDLAGNVAKVTITIIRQQVGIAGLPIPTEIIIGSVMAVISAISGLIAKRRKRRIRFREILPEE